MGREIERDGVFGEGPAIERPNAGAVSLFRLGNFHLHSGQSAEWKIDCDALTDADWAAVACMLSEILPPFGCVEGVATGGLKLAQAMRSYMAEGPLLIVDDVLTTGASMDTQRKGRDAIGAVVFARGQCPSWVTPLFQIVPKKAV